MCRLEHGCQFVRIFYLSHICFHVVNSRRSRDRATLAFIHIELFARAAWLSVLPFDLIYRNIRVCFSMNSKRFLFAILCGALFDAAIALTTLPDVCFCANCVCVFHTKSNRISWYFAACVIQPSKWLMSGLLAGVCNGARMAAVCERSTCHVFQTQAH